MHETNIYRYNASIYKYYNIYHKATITGIQTRIGQIEIIQDFFNKSKGPCICFVRARYCTQ